MKLIYIILGLCLIAKAPAIAQQQIKSAEYFFDTDPGVGQATAISTGVADDSVLLNLTLNVPLGLAPGIHFVYLRTYADSAGYNGSWSMTGRQEVIVKPEIVSAEYFIDTDPGVGNGLPITFSASDTILSNLNITVPTGLSSGQHYIYVRSKSDNGTWSLVQRTAFYITNSLVAAEYFLDTDPGVGNGTPFPISANDTVNENFSITLPPTISSGIHQLYTRTKSIDGVWGMTQRISFYVKSQLVAAEYFIDTDPGSGNGSPFSISPSDSVNETKSFTLPPTISSGMHQLYTRTKSVDGVWGLTQRLPFYVKGKVVAAEYFFDTDPGQGNGFPWTGSIAASDTVNSIADIHLPCLTAGMHFIYVRSQDALGVWSMAEMDTFHVSSPTLTLNSEQPGPGPYGTPVRLITSGGEGPYLYSMNGGPYVSDSLFLANNAAVVTFAVTDTCGYSGSTVVTTPIAPTQIATSNTSSISMLMNGWRYWVYLLDANGDIVAAIKDNEQNLGTVTAGHLINSGAVRQFPAAWESKYYLDRNYLVQSQYAPLDSVGLRLYALNSEYNALATIDPNINNLSDLRIVKYDGPNQDLSFSNNNTAAGGMVITPDSLVAFNSGSSAGYWLDFRVNSFSEFYQSSASSTPLYLHNLNLQAIPSQGIVQILWEPLNEKDVANYTILRSKDGANWKELGNLKAQNVETAHYSFDDIQPETGWNFYRLAITDIQDKVTFSIIVRVNITETRSIALYPNPASEELNIQGTKAKDQLSLQDATGREVWTGNAQSNSIKVPVGKLSSGVYLLRITGGDGSNWVEKVEVVK